MSVLPDPNTSRAVLIGTWRYTDPGLTSLPAVAENLKALARLLRDPGIWGLPKTHCTAIPNPATAAEAIDPIIEAAEQATDTLLVYYAGHGLIARRDAELHLALTGSRPNAAHTALPYATIRDELLDTRARRQVVILDCCYSGRALGRMAPADAATVLADEAAIEGTYLIAAAAETRTALSVPGEPHTAFTAELLTTLRRGIPGQGPHLDLDTLYRHIETTLRAKQRPLPQRRIRNTADRLAFHNRAHAPTRPAPTPTASEPAPPADPPRPHPAGSTRDTPRGIRRRAFIVGAVVFAGAGTATGAALWPWGESGDSVRARRLTDTDTEDVAFSPAGRTLVTIDGSSVSQVWDAATGKMIAESSDGQNGVSCVAFSPDGKTFATGCGNDIRVRDAATAVPIATFPTTSNNNISMVPLAFSPDGKMLACGGADTGLGSRDDTDAYDMKNSFRLLRTSTGLVRAASSDHNLRAVAFSPDGKTVACANEGGCWLWDVAGRRFGQEIGLRDNTHAVLFTPDGRLLVTAGEGGIRLWDTTSLRIKATLPAGTTYAVALNEGGRAIATAGPHGVQLWDMATRRPTATLTHNLTHSLAWSPDGRTLAGATSQSNAKITRSFPSYDSGCLLWQIPARLLPTSSGIPPTHPKG
ncbi:caspase family protein [Actinoallomurus sp. NPDC050550]|uniref:caspase, EACC1-associated type n=1 Tax=Actinoallomurus sp. NPDC050550 TaxID=3154937 RepID=UPI003410FFA1